MKFSLFRKTKTEPEAQAVPPEEPKEQPTTAISEEPKQESPAPTPQPEPTPPVAAESASTQEATEPVEEPKKETAEPSNKTYLKAMPLKELSDIENVKNEVKNGNIIILRVTPLANKSIDDVKTAVNQLYEFSESTGGDIARLGEERVVVCPKNIRIWREKTPVPTNSMPTTGPTLA